ncbi:MAG: 50S ribosomal protein L29 [Spirochaetaceae bacterium]|nr:50S ribosomal protein L29 [Spirochaetaceae bacterium]
MAKKTKLSELSIEELMAKRTETKKKYFDLRCQAVVGHVENPVLKRTMRRQIAALNTIIRQKELASDIVKK